MAGREGGSVEGMDGVTSVCSDRVRAMLPSHRLLAPSRDSFLASKDSLSCPSRASRHSTRQSPATCECDVMDYLFRHYFVLYMKSMNDSKQRHSVTGFVFMVLKILDTVPMTLHTKI